MFTTEIRLPELALLAGTRGALGAGVGLLLPTSSVKSNARTSVGRWWPLAC